MSKYKTNEDCKDCPMCSKASYSSGGKKLGKDFLACQILGKPIELIKVDECKTDFIQDNKEE